MMSALPQVVPISDMRVRQNELLAELKNGPIIFTQFGRSVAVLVGVDQWNELQNQLEYLEDSLDAIEIQDRIKAGEEPVRSWEEFEAELDAVPA